MSNLTIKTLTEYETLKTEKLELERKARELGKRIATIETLAQTALVESGQDELVKGRFIVHTIQQPQTIAWKQVCIREIGELRVRQIEAERNTISKLKIERR